MMFLNWTQMPKWLKQVFKLKQNGLFNLEVDDQSKIYEILSSMKHSLEDFIRHNW